MENRIILPEPQKDLSFPLMKAFEKRRTQRSWQPIPIAVQDLSNLLWAACGMTKAPYGKVKSKRTAPSACNAQEIRIYILLESGVFLYEEPSHSLVPICSNDYREAIGTQKIMKTAPLGLAFVADLSRMKSPLLKKSEVQSFCAWVDTGYISQNVYLYCAAAGLATAALSLVNRDRLHLLIGLPDHEKIVLTQVVGYEISEQE